VLPALWADRLVLGEDEGPIEAMWSRVWGILRSAKVRTAEALLDAIGMEPRSVTMADVEPWSAHRAVV
jgi:hypothetical protein